MHQKLESGDNFGELLAPLLLLVAILCETIFFATTTPMPFLAKTGTVRGWRMDKNGLLPESGESPLLLCVVFLIRVAFCIVEISVRQRQRQTIELRSRASSIDIELRQWAASIDQTAELRSRGASIDQTADCYRPVLRRSRSSAALIYNRIVHSREAPSRMKYMALYFIFMQSLLLVVNAARFGALSLSISVSTDDADNDDSQQTNY